MAETKISEIISQSLDKIRSLVDANTVIGTPIDAGAGTTIIPVSKISMGIASGGLDFLGKNKKDSGENNFGGGGGTGLLVTPVAFLIVHADGTVELMNVSNPTGKPADLGYNIASLVDRVPEIVEKIKSLFKKKSKDSEDESEETETAEDSKEN